MDQQKILLSHSGSSNPGFYLELCQEASKHACTISKSHLTSHTPSCSFYTYIQGPWDGIAKIEAFVENYQKAHPNHYTQLERLKPTSNTQASPHLAYQIEITGISNAHNLSHVSVFCNQHELTLLSIHSSQYQSSVTGDNMQQIRLEIAMDFDANLAEFREQLLLMCDSYNLDVVIEPMR